MSNKKSFMHWEILLVALFVSIGILYLPTRSVDIPKVGEFPTNMIKSLEKGGNIPIIIQNIMEQLNKEANLTYEEHIVFTLDSYCESVTYKDSLITGNKEFNPPTPPEPLSGLSSRTEVKCYVGELEAMKYYEEMFNEKYLDFRSSNPEDFDLDFSSVTYTSTMVKEGVEYFNKVETNDEFEVPIRGGEEKQIGKFATSPNFKIPTENPIEHPFDEVEVCIFASLCGATCHDVLERNPESNFMLKGDVPGLGCDAYFECVAPLDQFDKVFSCQKENDGEPENPVLCKRQCLPFCSAEPPLVNDADSATLCTEFSCISYLKCDNANSPATCGCPDSSSACQLPLVADANCETLHCERDSERETEIGIDTHCKDDCGKYGGCQNIEAEDDVFCSCDVGEACKGECYCNPQGWELALSHFK